MSALMCKRERGNRGNRYGFFAWRISFLANVPASPIKSLVGSLEDAIPSRSARVTLLSPLSFHRRKITTVAYDHFDSQ